MSSLFVLLAIIATACAYDNAQVEEWNMFKKNYGIQINKAEEDESRMKIYFINKNIIDKHNRRYELGLESYKLKINQFSSMAHQEYLNIAKGFKPNPRFYYVVLNHRKNLQSSTITPDSSPKLIYEGC